MLREEHEQEIFYYSLTLPTSNCFQLRSFLKVLGNYFECYNTETLLRSKEKHLLQTFGSYLQDSLYEFTSKSTHLKLESTRQPGTVVRDFLLSNTFCYFKNHCLISVVLKKFLSSPIGYRSILVLECHCLFFDSRKFKNAVELYNLP